MLPKNIAKLVPKDKLMNEPEWRGIGVQQSQGWIHYMRHRPGKRPVNCVCSRILVTPTSHLQNLTFYCSEDRERIVKRSMDVAKLVPLGFAFEDKWYVQGYVQEV